MPNFERKILVFYLRFIYIYVIIIVIIITIKFHTDVITSHVANVGRTVDKVRLS